MVKTFLRVFLTVVYAVFGAAMLIHWLSQCNGAPAC